MANQIKLTVGGINYTVKSDESARPGTDPGRALGFLHLSDRPFQTVRFSSCLGPVSGHRTHKNVRDQALFLTPPIM